MKKFLFILLLSPLGMMAQTKAGFIIKGNINGLADGEVKIVPAQQEGNTKPVATAVSKSGLFTLKGSVPEPGLYFLNLKGEQAQYVYLENKPISITGIKKSIKKTFKVTGSQSHLDFIEFNTIFNPLIGNLNAVVAELQNPANGGRQAFFMQAYDSIINKVNVEVDKFIARKKTSYVSPFLLFVTAQFIDDPVKMDNRYHLLDTSIRNSIIGKSLGDMIAYNKVGAVGSPAPEFTQNDVSNKPVSLASFKGKYILLDFWASWCGPCRGENPNVVAAYDKFKDKNFTVVGISLDKEKAAWLHAIDTDKLTWTHLSDLGYWQNAVAQQYHISSIPQNFLIDPTGNIIAKNLRGEALQMKLCELLGCN